MPSPTLIALLRSPLFIISTTTLICLLLSASLLQHQHQKRLESRTGHYGGALASLAAGQATDATLNHDLVSLQVTVSDIARNPHVLSATIHDVDGRLLVQAGDSPNTGDYSHRDHRSFTSPITLHDSIAGHVTVTIDTQLLYEQQNDTWLIALIGLAAALLVLSVVNLRQKTPSEPEADIDVNSNQSEDELPSRHQAPAGDIEVSLSLRCLNWPTIKQQLSSTLRQQLFDDLQRHLNGINTLYGGRVTHAEEDLLELSFSGDDLGNTSFRAICAAQLLFALMQQGSAGVQLHYAGAIYRPVKSANLNLHIQQTKFRQQLFAKLLTQANHSLLLDAQNCSTAQLLPRLQASQETDDELWLLVAGLQPSYQGLLDKQAEQLQHIAAS